MRSAHVDLVLAREPIDKSLLPVVDLPPVRDGVGLVSERGGVYEVFVFAQAHVGFLGEGVAG